MGGRAQTSEVPGHVLDLAHALELLEETREVVLAVELAIAERADVVVDLLLDDLGDGGVLGLLELVLGDFALGSLVLRRGDRVGADQRADVVGVEGEFGDGHDCWEDVKGRFLEK